MIAPTAVGDPPTERQRMILDLVRGSIRERGYPPSIREMMAATGVGSTNGIMCHVRALQRKGLLRHDGKTCRSFVPIGDATAPTVSREGPPLTDRQAKILAIIADSILLRGIPPTRREVMATLGYNNPNTVAAHVKALERKGYVRVTPNVARGLAIVRDGEVVE
jgi:SOS-response transcriptional repressor LexA